MGRKGEGAHQRHRLAEAHGKTLTRRAHRHEPNATHRKQRRPDVEHRGATTRHKPPDKRHDHAIGGREERIDARGSMLQANGLRKKSAEIEHAEQNPHPQEAQVKAGRHALTHDEQQNNARTRKPNAEQPCRRQDAHHVLHKDERHAPNGRSYDDEDLVGIGRQVVEREACGHKNGLLQ